MSEAKSDNENQSPEHVEAASPLKFRAMLMWNLILGIYLFLLIIIGYIAFWDQDFNNPKNTIGEYVAIINE